MKCGSCRSGRRPGSTWAGCSLALGFLSPLEEHPRFAPRCLLDDGLCLERSFYLCVSPGWCTERCEFKTRWNKRRHKPLFLPVRDFMSFTRAIKLLSALDSCGVLPSGGDAIKERVFSAGGVPAGCGRCTRGGGVLRHGWQGVHNGAARSHRLRPDSVAAAQPGKQPHHGCQGNRCADTHRSQTGKNPCLFLQKLLLFLLGYWAVWRDGVLGATITKEK